ncbi:MAG: hypothetical protein IKB20_05135 [Clostridia bacterium]|nr:hypothetical protein [Clostridia bacterium]
MKSCILAGIAALAFYLPNTLKEVAKPYLGVYECKEAKLGNEDYLQRFEDITLELKGNGEFILTFREKGGRERREKGKYTYDEKREAITLDGGAIKRQFPLKDGALRFQLSLGGKWLSVLFEQK